MNPNNVNREIPVPDPNVDSQFLGDDVHANDDNYKDIIDSLLHNKRQAKRIEGIKNNLLKPIKDGLAEVNKTYRSVEKPLGEAIDKLTDSLREYLSDRHTNLLEEYSKLSDKKQTPAILAKMKDIDEALANGYKGDGGKISIRTLNQFEITDIAKVPHRYLTLNSTKVREDLKHMDRIPGIKQVSNHTIAVYLDKDDE